MDAEDARAWCAYTQSAHLAPGTYTTRVQDQHRSGWCGVCYMVAVVHMIQDRWNVAVGTNAASEMHPYVELDMQRMMDEYNASRRAMHPRWNACHGGDPKRVLACMQSGDCRLYQASSEG